MLCLRRPRTSLDFYSSCYLPPILGNADRTWPKFWPKFGLHPEMCASLAPSNAVRWRRDAASFGRQDKSRPSASVGCASPMATSKCDATSSSNCFKRRSPPPCGGSERDRPSAGRLLCAWRPPWRPGPSRRPGAGSCAWREGSQPGPGTASFRVRRNMQANKNTSHIAREIEENLIGFVQLCGFAQRRNPASATSGASSTSKGSNLCEVGQQQCQATMMFRTRLNYMRRGKSVTIHAARGAIRALRAVLEPLCLENVAGFALWCLGGMPDTITCGPFSSQTRPPCMTFNHSTSRFLCVCLRSRLAPERLRGSRTVPPHRPFCVLRAPFPAVPPLRVSLIGSPGSLGGGPAAASGGVAEGLGLRRAHGPRPTTSGSISRPDDTATWGGVLSQAASRANHRGDRGCNRVLTSRRVAHPRPDTMWMTIVGCHSGP